MNKDKCSLTSSRELLTNPVSFSKAKSLTLGIRSSQGVKLYTFDRGSCNQCTPGLKNKASSYMSPHLFQRTHLNRTLSNPCANCDTGKCSDIGATSIGSVSIASPNQHSQIFLPVNAAPSGPIVPSSIMSEGVRWGGAVFALGFDESTTLHTSTVDDNSTSKSTHSACPPSPPARIPGPAPALCPFQRP